MKVSFALHNKPKAPSTTSLRPPAAFSSVGDDEPVDAAPTIFDHHNAAANKKLLVQNVEGSKSMRKRIEAEKKVDETVYQYDEVWDRIQEAKQRQKDVKDADAKERKVGRLTSF
jgi:coiled-coil domain-containing protein 55